jgi:glycosyltransferase involved in cell wall biosynthesis
VEPTQGLSRARNRGLSESKSEIVAYLDDDTLPEEDWLQKILEPFADSRVAVVTGRVKLPDQNNRSDQFTSSFSLDKQNPLWFEMAVFGGLGAGCNMAFRKSACNLPKMFDERLGRGAPYRGGEEHLAFAKLLSYGHMAVYMSTATVYHFSENPRVVARYLVAYILLLASQFPKNRIDIWRYLIRRLQRKPLSWGRDAPDPGELIQSSWLVWLKAAVSGTMLYLRTRKVS